MQHKTDKKGAFSTQITDQKLSFKENEVEVAYVSNQELRITKATVENQMQFADFVIRPSGKRGIVFAYVGRLMFPHNIFFKRKELI